MRDFPLRCLRLWPAAYRACYRLYRKFSTSRRRCQAAFLRRKIPRTHSPPQFPEQRNLQSVGRNWRTGEKPHFQSTRWNDVPTRITNCTVTSLMPDSPCRPILRAESHVFIEKAKPRSTTRTDARGRWNWSSGGSSSLEDRIVQEIQSLL